MACYPCWNIRVALCHPSGVCPANLISSTSLANLDSSDIPRELRSDLNGPKWVRSGTRRPISRAPSISLPATRKHRPVPGPALSARSRSLQSTSRRLYEDTPSFSSSASSGDVDSDDCPTPRPSDRGAGDGSFVHDLFPRIPPLALL